MLKKVQQKWAVSGWRFILILVTFAVGGSLTGLAGRQLMGLLHIRQLAFYIPAYIIVVTLIWPVMVLLVSIPLGQFNFFLAYLKKMGQRFGMRKKEELMKGKKISLAIFASGAGSNAQQIIRYFKNSSFVEIALIVCNKPGAGVLQIAGKENIPTLIINKEQFINGDAYLPELKKYQIDFIVLAGFLWKIPGQLIEAYPKRIINIHPALLPNYGGKGMYGNRVHAAVIEAGEKESGITIHYVDEHYDNGDIIFQGRCLVHNDDSAETLAKRIHELEYRHFPEVIESVIRKEFS